MGVQDLYHYVLEMYRPGGELVHQVALTPDWEPAVAWTRLVGLRTHGVWVAESEAEPRIEPLWHVAMRRPFVHGFRVLMPHSSGFSADFVTARYFADIARETATGLLTTGRLAAGERVMYRTAAFEAFVDAKAARPLRFETAERVQPPVLKHADLTGLLSDAVLCGEPHADDVEVVIPGQTLQEAVALTKAAPATEIGGILIGHLHRDPSGGDLCVEVTAQIAARHTLGSAVKLTFTSETWTDVRRAIALRARGELMLGWWHSHCAREWCKACPTDRQALCPLATGFLSADDRTLHRTMFPSAFSLALVVTNAITGIESKLFGWRSGVLEPRGFRLVDGDASDLGAAVRSSASSGSASAAIVECETSNHTLTRQSREHAQTLILEGGTYAETPTA
jgi:hypothetical protein